MPADEHLSRVPAAGNVHPEFRSFWHPVAWSDEIDDSSLFATALLDEPLVLHRTSDGSVVALRDECPHRGAPLSRGCLDDGEVVCGFHGWRFDGTSGAATVIPSLGAATAPPSRARVTRYRAAERHGMVWVALDDPRLPIADWRDGDDSTLGGYEPTAHTADVLAAYQTDNLLDASHFPFLHRSLSSRNPRLGEYETVEMTELGFRTSARKLHDDGETTEGWLRYTYAAPFTVLLRSEEPDGRLRSSFFQVAQPIDECHTRLFFLVRVPQTDAAALTDMLAVEEGVQLEDLAMNRALRRTSMPLTGAVDLHVRTDRNGVLLRQVLHRLLYPSSDRDET